MKNMNHRATLSIRRGAHKITFLLICLAFCQLSSCEPGKKCKEPCPPKCKQQVAYGIDISHYQGNELDFVARKRDSLSFVICKATEGKTFVDPKFKSNWELLKKKKFIRGAYHYFRCEDQPEAQANLYINTVGELGLSDLPPIVDVEVVDQCTSHTEIQNRLLAFLEILKKRTRRIPMIYVDPSFANEYLRDRRFAKYPLWVADWTSAAKPSLPSTWRTAGWTLWQKTNEYDIHSTKTDFDCFNGNVEELKQFIWESALSY
jgi:lysozyme